MRPKMLDRAPGGGSRWRDMSYTDVWAHHFTIEVTPSGDTYSSHVVEYPGVHSQGDTMDEAVNNALDAVRQWREAE
jgi:hypothetical protein